MAQITSITSEALQATIRRLLPSQQGFGEDLQAQNVIVPVIDLTPTAEGTALPQYLQEALNFVGATAFSSDGSDETIANVAGFWRVTAVAACFSSTAENKLSRLRISDGSTTKTIWQLTTPDNASNQLVSESVDFVIYLRPTDSIIASSGSTGTFVGSVRQVADNNGNLIVPSGFTFE